MHPTLNAATVLALAGLALASPAFAQSPAPATGGEPLFTQAPAGGQAPPAASGSGSASSDPAAVQATVSEWLGRLLTMEAVRTFATDIAMLVPEDIRLAVLLAGEGARLQPENGDAWRTYLQGADAAGDRRAALEALQRLSVIDPGDQSIQLRRILAEIGQRSTVEERVAAFTSLLDPDRRARLPRPMASRLAVELAILLDRAGDRDGMLEWLKEAIAIDPFNSIAAEMAVIELAPGAPAERVTELLVARCLSNPANLAWLEQLAVYALEHGAYEAAYRLLDLTVACHGGVRQAPSALVVDRALATWALGRTDEALTLLDMRARAAQDLFNELTDSIEYYDSTLRATLSPSQIEAGDRERAARMQARADVIRAIVDLESIRLLVLAGAERDTELEQAANALAAASRRLSQDVGMVMPGDRAAMAAPLRDAAEIIFFAGGPADLAEALLAESLSQAPAPERQSARMSGWRALRDGRPEDARAAFEPGADSDPGSALGLAMVEREGGDQRRAAMLLLRVARAEPARARSVCALDRLVALLGTRAPLSTDAAAIDSVVATMPRTFDRLVSDPGRSLLLRVSTPTDTVSSGDAIYLDVEITNRSGLPLALAPGGPIMPDVAVPFTITSVAAGRVFDRIQPPLLSFGGPLSLATGEAMRSRVNLSRGVIGHRSIVQDLVASLSVLDALQILNIRGILNPAFVPTSSMPGAMEPGRLGTQSIPINLNIVGLRSDRGYLQPLIQALRGTPTADDLRLAALVLQQYFGSLEARSRLDQLLTTTTETAVRERYAAELAALNAAFPMSDVRAFSDALQFAYASFTPVEQAWLLLSLPPAIGLRTAARLAPLSWIVERGRNSPEPIVQIAALVRYTGESPDGSWSRPSEDPLIERCVVSPDPVVREVALLRQAILRAADGGS